MYCNVYRLLSYNNVTNGEIMMDKKFESNIYGKDKILYALLRDPTRSDSEIAKEIGTYRQKVWRRRKQLEDEKALWGYTAVIDDSKFNHVSYMILMKTKTMNRELVELLLQRITHNEPARQDIRLKNMFYVNGEYDWIMRFTAPDHATARKYYETIRLLYSDHLQERPILMDINMSLVAEGKKNPNLDQLFDYVP